ADLTGAILTEAYLRGADLRGEDLRHMDLEGCSFLHAKVCGTYFPESISPEEIRLSIEHGQRHPVHGGVLSAHAHRPLGQLPNAQHLAAARQLVVPG
ncbi:MAG: pentapeptide repeat-containing protein, partial [Proteobacteria bacterium]|nr:pentapeptide repeat-containing protein [Pseudomonadota bacterium]